MQSLGDRIKRYEAVSRHTLTPNTPLFIRVDGRAFHTLTKSCDKPFDFNLVDAMTHAAKETAKEMQGFKLGYVQSDEATFMLSDFDRITSEGWFGYDLNKVVSLSAALFTQLQTSSFDCRKTLRSAYAHLHPADLSGLSSAAVLLIASEFGLRAPIIALDLSPDILFWLRSAVLPCRY